MSEKSAPIHPAQAFDAVPYSQIVLTMVSSIAAHVDNPERLEAMTKTGLEVYDKIIADHVNESYRTK